MSSNGAYGGYFAAMRKEKESRKSYELADKILDFIREVSTDIADQRAEDSEFREKLAQKHEKFDIIDRTLLIACIVLSIAALMTSLVAFRKCYPPKNRGNIKKSRERLRILSFLAPYLWIPLTLCLPQQHPTFG